MYFKQRNIGDRVCCVVCVYLNGSIRRYTSYLDRSLFPAPRAGFHLRAGFWAWNPARDRAENEKQKKLKKSCSCSGGNSARVKKEWS